METLHRYQTRYFVCLEKCFTCALYRNKNDEAGLKQALEAIVPHAFGDHTQRNENWCGSYKDPVGYSVRVFNTEKRILSFQFVSICCCPP